MSACHNFFLLAIKIKADYRLFLYLAATCITVFWLARVGTMYVAQSIWL
jgi:hypothetical protein